MTENEMTGLLLKLADLGVTGIKVHYDGGGDSGAIEEIAYTTKPCLTPDDVDDNAEMWGADALDLASIDSAAHSLIQDFANEKLLDDIEDWWNNEGGWGNILICVPSGEYRIDSHIRITTSEYYPHEGSLIEKSVE